MTLSAIYGVARYGQSHYGRIHVFGSSDFSFNHSVKLKAEGVLKGQPTFFAIHSSASLHGGREGSTALLFSDQVSVTPSTDGKAELFFSGIGNLSNQAVPLYGETTIAVSDIADLILVAPQTSSTSFLFNTEGHAEGKAGLVGQSDLSFNTLRALTNALKFSGETFLNFLERADLSYKNKNPSYQSWNGHYEHLKNVTDFNIGYFGLLLDQTSGETQSPYVETMNE